MNPDLLREWRRWTDADADGREDEAEAGFRAVFRSVPMLTPGAGLTDRLVHAVARAAERRTRRTRLAGLAAVVAGGLGAVIAILPHLPRLLFHVVNLAVSATLWIVQAFERGVEIWSALAQLGRAAGAAMTIPAVTLWLVGVELLGVTALYALHRVLTSEQESTR